MQQLIFQALKTVIWMQLTFVEKISKQRQLLYIKIYINMYFCEISY